MTALATVPVAAAAPSIARAASEADSSSPIQFACAEILRIDEQVKALPPTPEPSLLVPASISSAALTENADFAGLVNDAEREVVERLGRVPASMMRYFIKRCEVTTVELLDDNAEWTAFRIHRKPLPLTDESSARIGRLQDLVAVAEKYEHQEDAPGQEHDRIVDEFSDAQIEHEITVCQTRSETIADLLAKTHLFLSDPDRYHDAPTEAPVSLSESIMADIVALFGDQKGHGFN